MLLPIPPRPCRVKKPPARLAFLHLPVFFQLPQLTVFLPVRLWFLWVPRLPRLARHQGWQALQVRPVPGLARRSDPDPKTPVRPLPPPTMPYSPALSYFPPPLCFPIP